MPSGALSFAGGKEHYLARPASAVLTAYSIPLKDVVSAYTATGAANSFFNRAHEQSGSAADAAVGEHFSTRGDLLPCCVRTFNELSKCRCRTAHRGCCGRIDPDK